MQTKKIQKSFYFSNEINKDLIEHRIEDISAKTGETTSSIIEQTLLDGLLPKNDEAMSLVRNYLYGQENNGIKKTLEAAFSRNSGRTGEKSKHSNYKPLVDFCCDSVVDAVYNFHNYRWEDLLDLFDSIYKMIENCSVSCIEPYDAKMYTSKSLTSKMLFNQAAQNSSEIQVKRHFELICDCWPMLDTWSITYKYLAGLVAISDFAENAIKRETLFEMINNLTREWTQFQDPMKEDDYFVFIDFKYRPNESYKGDLKATDLYANDVNVGTLAPLSVGSDRLVWRSDINLLNPRFLFRNESTFRSVVSEISRYKEENNFRYLTIWPYSRGYASVLDPKMLERAGFHHISGEHMDCLFLE